MRFICFISNHPPQTTMADNPSTLPQDAAKRLMELKKKILAGSSSKPKTDVAEPEKPKQAPPQPNPTTEPVSTKKQPLTMKSLMSSRRSSRRGSEEGTEVNKATVPQGAIAAPVAPVQASPTTQPSPAPFVSRLKEAPAHRAADGAASKPKVISLTKTWVTTTQEREARQAAAESAAAVQDEKIVKKPKIVKAIVKKVEPDVVIAIPRDNREIFLREHRQWVNRMVQKLGPLTTQTYVRADRSDPHAFISHHRQFIKSSI